MCGQMKVYTSQHQHFGYVPMDVAKKNACCEVQILEGSLKQTYLTKWIQMKMNHTVDG